MLDNLYILFFSLWCSDTNERDNKFYFNKKILLNGRKDNFNRLWKRFTSFNFLAKENMYDTSNESIACKLIFMGSEIV